MHHIMAKTVLVRQQQEFTLVPQDKSNDPADYFREIFTEEECEFVNDLYFSTYFLKGVQHL